MLRQNRAEAPETREAKLWTRQGRRLKLSAVAMSQRRPHRAAEGKRRQHAQQVRPVAVRHHSLLTKYPRTMEYSTVKVRKNIYSLCVLIMGTLRSLSKLVELANAVLHLLLDCRE